MSSPLRLAFVTGTEPGKWFARYRADHQLEDIPSDDPFELVASGTAQLALVRVPDERIGQPGERFHQVLLYEEKPGVAVPKDSLYDIGEPLSLIDVSDEAVNYTYPNGTTDDLRMALQVVAANVGVVFAPAPLLKVLSKKQVVVAELKGGPAHEQTAIALVWKVEDDSDAIQDFVGVAKGRTRNSSRSSAEKRRGSNVSENRANSKVKGKSSGQRKGFSRKHPKKG
nr:LysR substrate binding domain [Streptococcus thermophilus]